MFAVYGKTFANDMIPVDYEQDGIRIHGFTVKPLYAKANRSYQTFFVNNRYVKSQVCSSALEEAYKGAIMVGKFPACVLKIELLPDTIDVNVHPAKVEIRFSDDRPIYDCMFFAIKSALMKAGLVYDFRLQQAQRTAAAEEEYYQPSLADVCSDSGQKAEEVAVSEKAESAVREAVDETVTDETQNSTAQAEDDICDVPVSEPEAPVKSVHHISEAEPSVPVARPVEKNIALVSSASEIVSYAAPVPSEAVKLPVPEKKPCGNYSFISSESLEKKKAPPVPEKPVPEKPELRYIGEVFKGYIIAEVSEKIVIIDKHAAHERIIFERLRAEDGDPASQLVLCPEGILLSLDEADALMENLKVLENMGFGLDFGNSPYVSVKAVPTIIAHLNMDEIIPELADNFRKNRIDPRPEAIDDILHSMACKAAIKMNDKNSDAELKKLAEDVYFNEKIRHCPHGRPVMFVISKYELEKQFRRIV
jgi:DNA mismatch repair protein MutL